MLNGAKIRQLRNDKGYTTLDIENMTKKNPKYATSISKSYLEELERGTKLNPSFTKVELLSEILCCNIDDLRQKDCVSI